MGRFFLFLPIRKEFPHHRTFLPVPIPPGTGNSYYRDLRSISLPKGKVIWGEVEFSLQDDSLVFDTSKQLRDYFQLQDGSIGKEMVLASSIGNIKSIYVLINSGKSKKEFEWSKIGAIILEFVNGPPQETELILGHNIRDMAPGKSPGNLVDRTDDPLCRMVWSGTNKSGYYSRVDMLEIPLLEENRSKLLKSIRFIHSGYHSNKQEDGVQYLILGISLEILGDNN